MQLTYALTDGGHPERGVFQAEGGISRATKSEKKRRRGYLVPLPDVRRNLIGEPAILALEVQNFAGSHT